MLIYLVSDNYSEISWTRVLQIFFFFFYIYNILCGFYDHRSTHNRISRLTCFSDCQELVLLINSGGRSNEIQGLLLDIKALREYFQSVVFQFIPWAQNSEAELLAKSRLVPPTNPPRLSGWFRYNKMHTSSKKQKKRSTHNRKFVTDHGITERKLI